MFPLAISGIVSLADTALQTWNRVADSRAAEKASQQVDFEALVDKARSVAPHGAVQGKSPLSAQEIQRRLKALPEIKAALDAAGPGAPVSLEVSQQQELLRVLPNGSKQPVALSPESQAAIRQLIAAVNPGGPFPMTLVA